jgi:hypothetical protein
MLASRDKHCQTVMAACGISVARGGTDDLSAPCTGESPVGVHQAGSYMALPLLLFEKASTEAQKLAVMLGSVLTAGAIIVNA